MPTISLIILSFNSSKYMDGLLTGIVKIYQSELKEKKLEVIVADNASSDDTKKIVEKFKAHVVWVENGDNYGFAKGNNLAAKKAHGEIIIFMNPDAKIVSGSIFDLSREFENEKVGIVGGKILNYHGGRELSCGKFYTLFNTILLACGLEESFGVRFAPEKRKSVDIVSGAFLAIRKTLFDRLHGFDEHYFMYIEDSDLCFRAKKLGYEVIFSPDATIQHVGQGSSNRAFAIVNIYKGLFYFHKKHMGSFSYHTVVFFLKLKAILLVIYGKISNNQYLVSAYEEAFKTS